MGSGERNSVEAARMTRRPDRRGARLSTRSLSYLSRLRAFGPSAHFYGRSGLSDNGTTGTWTDLVAGYALSATTTRPSLRAGGGWTFAGAQYLAGDIALAGLVDDSALYTQYMVLRVDAAAGTAGVIATCAASATQYVMHGDTAAARNTFAWRNDGGGSTVNTGTVNHGHGLHVQSSVFTGSACSAWDDGVITLNESANTRAPASCTRFAVGARRLASGTNDRFWVGDIVDVLIFAGVNHSAEVRQSIEVAMRAEYAIS